MWCPTSPIRYYILSPPAPLLPPLGLQFVHDAHGYQVLRLCRVILAGLADGREDFICDPLAEGLGLRCSLALGGRRRASSKSHELDLIMWPSLLNLYRDSTSDTWSLAPEPLR